MEWHRLLSTRRLGRPDDQNPAASDPRADFARDWDRLIFSSAFRRLQDKTQVFPLAKSDYVRTRLTHSLEVASVGRSLGMRAADVILRREPSLGSWLTPQDVGMVVSTACLAHDLGNPPFGHAGESAIQEWFDVSGQEYLTSLTPQERADFLRFEGNAQGFRTLCALQYAPQYGGMQLTHAVLGAFTKYPRASVVDAPQAQGISGKKFGFMRSEEALFGELADALGLLRKPGHGGAWHRHPLAFLVEAADDICYHIIDVEDGFKVGVVSYDELVALYEPWLKAEHLEKADLFDDRQRRAEYFRAVTVGALVQEAVDVFDAQYDGLMSGAFDDEFAAHIERAGALRAFKDLARQQVYRAQPVIEVEACGFEVIAGLLGAFMDAVTVTAGQRAQGRVRARTLIDLLPQQITVGMPAYQQALAVTDFVAGMTDSCAVTLYQRIRGISLP